MYNGHYRRKSMKYSIEISKILEAALNKDNEKVLNYGYILLEKLKKDNDRSSSKIEKILANRNSLALKKSDALIHSLPVDIDSRIMLADFLDFDSNNGHSILSMDNEEIIEEFIQSYNNSELLYDKGIESSNSMILYGPPGCGKTKTALYIAKKVKLPIIIARLDSIISSLLGTTAKNIRALFDYANKRPCVLLLDEFDAIAKARNDTHELGELKRVVNSLLQNIDNMDHNSIIIAATNHEDLLDHAVWRRFDYKIHIDYPDLEMIKKLIVLFMSNNEIFSSNDIEELSYAFNGMNGSTIEDILKKATRYAILNNKEFCKNHIYFEIFRYFKSSKKDWNNSVSDKARYLRSCNIDKNIFTLEVIADIISVSKSQVSYLLKEGE